jgi:DNA-binding response OmpR family regulator
MDSLFGNMMTLDVRKKTVPLPWIKKKVLSLHTEDNNRMRKLFIFLSLCFSLMAAAQPATDTAFKTLGIADGLRSNSVTSVLADSRGYLWIGTYQGLNRYDGHQVKTRFPESGDQSFFDGRSGRGDRSHDSLDTSDHGPVPMIPPADVLKTILVVDDNQDMLSFVSSCMKESFNVFTASDGAAALEILQREQVNLIISDVMMPGIDGFELCRRVKSDITLSHIPIILLTARTTDVSRIEGLQLGADDYLTKPFNVEVLRLRVNKFIDWEQNNHQLFRQKMNIEPSEITITPLDEQFIQKAIALVEKNISDSEFSVETMASEVGMSRSTLYKKLMAITGLGPAEFIRTIRVKRSKALLETSQMQITEIAYAVGFTTVKSFTMNFKAEYGVTPTEFRQKQN